MIVTPTDGLPRPPAANLTNPQAALVNIVLHDRQPAAVAVLVPKPLEDPLRRVPLLRRTALIVLKDPVDDPDERIQLRSRWSPRPPVPGRHREHHHLRDRPGINPEPPRRLPATQSLDLNRVPNPSI